MAQRAGRVGVNPADVDPVTGHVNVEVPGNVYTKTQVDNKFLTKTKAASDYQTKELSIPIQLLDGSALTVEEALAGINTDYKTVVDISSQATFVEQSHYEVTGFKAYKVGSIIFIYGIIKSLDITNNPAGTPFNDIISGLPGAKYGDYMCLFDRGDGGVTKPVQFKVDTTGKVQVRGGTASANTIYFNLIYLT